MKLTEEAQEVLERLWIELVEKKKKNVAPKHFDEKILKELEKKQFYKQLSLKE